MAYPIEIIKQKIDDRYLKKFLGQPFKEMIKFVVDIKQAVIALGGELHSDAAELLIKQGSDNRNLWGGNLYPLKSGKDRIEYSSLINIKPSQANNSIEIQKKDIRQKIDQLVKKLINEK